MFEWIYKNKEQTATLSKESFFGLSDGTKIVLGIFGVAAIFFGIGYALRPIEEVFDDLHDSRENRILSEK